MSINKKLIVHIGAGKTGSSSIQAALKRSEQALSDRKAKYLGMMLEHGATTDRPEWQQQNGSRAFFTGLKAEEARQQLSQALLYELSHPDHAQFETLIWSNEWFNRRSDRIIPVLKLLEQKGVDVEILIYVRGHDRWITSAYVQWGLKNKRYTGPVKSFADWVKDRKFDFESVLTPWLDAFGDKLVVLNFDTAGDVAEHFFDRIDIPLNSTSRANVSPSAEKLAAWSVYNNRFKSAVPESRFAIVLRNMQMKLENTNDVPELDALMPGESDLMSLREEYSTDQAFVNQLLAASGEPELSDGPEIKLHNKPDGWEMDRLLLNMLFDAEARISALEERLESAE